MNTKRLKRRLSRKSLTPEQLQVARWAEPVTDGWEDGELHRYNLFKSAITDYLGGEKTDYVERKYDIRISQLQEQIWRAMQVDSDSEYVGFRALIPNLHVTPTIRRKELPSGMHPSASCCSGAFQKLIRKEGLLQDIENEVLKRGTGPHAAQISVLDIQKKICRILTDRGYAHDDYPFTTHRPLYSSLSRLIQKIRREHMVEDVAANDSPVAAGNIRVQNGYSGRQKRPRPGEDVECDEHKLHAIGAVRITLDGIDKVIPTERPVGIAIVDIGSHVVLGASVCLNPEAKEDALIEAIRSAVSPNYIIRLPNGDPAPKFRPCDFYPELSGAVWTSMHLDNAKIHTSDRYLTTASRIGTRTRFGPLGSWSGRPNIEGTFGRLVTGFFSRIPSTTGSAPFYTGRKSPAEQAIKYAITIDDLCRLFYEGLASINTNSTEGVLYQSPINVYRDFFWGESKPFMRQLPPPTAKSPSVGAQVVQLKVCRRSENNPNLYVSYKSVKYTNSILSVRSELRGHYIIAHIDFNIRRIEAFTPDGRALGALIADGYWGTQDHTAEIRQMVMRGKDNRFGQHEQEQPAIYKMLQDKAKIVLQRSRRRGKGSVIKEALELQRFMVDTGLKEIHVQSVDTSTSQLVVTMKTSEAAKRAREAKRAVELVGAKNEKK